MPVRLPTAWAGRVQALFPQTDRGILLLGLSLHLVAALFFGHFYDMRIFMATGYLVGTGQNPYVAQDLRAVFNNPAFQGMTSVGYPPPWPLVLGGLYRGVYVVIPNLLLYNLAIKLPVVAANFGLAYAAAGLLKTLGASSAISRRAWVFLLLNPFLLYFTSAWGQIDSLVALAALGSLVLLNARKLTRSAILLALAIALKPTPLPLLIVAVVNLMGVSLKHVLRYLAVFLAAMFLFCIVPFVGWAWDPSPILKNWNAHFTVGGGMSFMTFFELLQGGYQLPGNWWFLGLAWLPALGLGSLALSGGGRSGLVELLKKSLGLELIFFLTRTWLSEPNIALILPWVLILTSLGELDGLALLAVWALPLIFTVFNSSPPQLLFPSFPEAMVRLLHLADQDRAARLVARIVTVIPWQIAGWWIVVACLRKGRSTAEWK